MPNTKLSQEFSAWITEDHNCWQGGLQSILDNLDKLDYVMPCLLRYDSSGLQISDSLEAHQLFDICRANSLPMMPLTAGDPEAVAKMLYSESTREAHIAELIDYVNKMDFIGLDVDYEFLPEELRNPYTEFVARLTAEAEKYGKLISIDLHPKVRPDDPWSTGARAQDWKALAPIAHILRVMCYDQYCPVYKYADPGPVSTLAWSEAVINYAASVIPLEKLIMGVPFYGMDFDTVDSSRSKWIFYKEAAEKKAKYGSQEQWSNSFGVPFFTYEDELSHLHQVWYETGKSVAGKVNIARKYGVRGISCWAIADEDPTVWTAVADTLS